MPKTVKQSIASIFSGIIGPIAALICSPDGLILGLYHPWPRQLHNRKEDYWRI